jgi:hypothetical protein
LNPVSDTEARLSLSQVICVDLPSPPLYLNPWLASVLVQVQVQVQVQVLVQVKVQVQAQALVQVKVQVQVQVLVQVLVRAQTYDMSAQYRIIMKVGISVM